MARPENTPVTAASSGAERRRTPRYNYATRTAVTIMIPEETFRPAVQYGNTMDVSIGGARVMIEEFPRTVYQKLLRGLRHVKLDLEVDTPERTLELRGQLVWIEYHAARTEDVGHCILGVSFAKMTDELQAKLTGILQRGGKLALPPR